MNFWSGRRWIIGMSLEHIHPSSYQYNTTFKLEIIKQTSTLQSCVVKQENFEVKTTLCQNIFVPIG